MRPLAHPPPLVGAPPAPAGVLRDHGPWLLAGLTMIAVALAHLALLLATPSDGARVPPGAYGLSARGLQVAPIVTGAGGLAAGDLVVAVEGVRLGALADAPLATRSARPVVAGPSARYEVVRGGETLDLVVPLGPYPLAAVVRQNWGTIVFALVYLLVAGFVYARRPSVGATRPFFLSGAALLAATTWSLGLTVADVLDGWGFWLFHAGSVVGFMLFWTAGLHFALTFPSPLPIARHPSLPWLLYGAPYLALALYATATRTLTDGTLAWAASWATATGVHASAALSLTLLAFVAQYRAQRAGAGRGQIRWVVFAALLAGGAGLVLYLVPPLVGLTAVHPNVIGVIVSLFPLSIAVAVLRQNLFDIDRLMSHALVYGGLTAGVVGVYVTVVVVLGRMVGGVGDLWPSLLATAVVAVAFQPLRARLQGIVDRRLFGDRGEPVRVLGRLGERLEATAETDRVLPILVETIAEALRLPYVALVLDEGEARVAAAEYGRPLPVALELPLVDQGAVVGRLLVAPRDVGADLSMADRELLATVARQAGSAVRAVRLTSDLRRSRQEIVTLREEERRRLRRDLHDGLGPTLAAMALKLDAARNLLRREPGRADALLAGLADQVQGAVGEIRRLVHALRPPALDELGLAGALREHARQIESYGVRLEVEAPEAALGLSAAAEVAVYRIVQEALTNVVKHAGARTVSIVLTERDGRVAATIEDDGRGFDREALGEDGFGLVGMRERVALVGGRLAVESSPGAGTTIAVEVPAA
jgi:two-component system, NarL family, sensor kinase